MQYLLDYPRHRFFLGFHTSSMWEGIKNAAYSQNGSSRHTQSLSCHEEPHRADDIQALGRRGTPGRDPVLSMRGSAPSSLPGGKELDMRQAQR